MLAHRCHAFVNRMLPALVVALVVVVPFPSGAQGRDKEKEAAVVVFVHSVSARILARMCVRGIPAYRQRFDDLYTRWREKHRDWIAWGESAFQEELSHKDQPQTARERLELVERAVAELATDPVHTDPLELDDRLRAVCERNLTELEKTL